MDGEVLLVNAVDTVIGVVGNVSVGDTDAVVPGVIEDEGKVEDDGGLSVESNICRLKRLDDEHPFIFKPSFSAICTDVGVETDDKMVVGIVDGLIESLVGPCLISSFDFGVRL